MSQIKHVRQESNLKSMVLETMRRPSARAQIQPVQEQANWTSRIRTGEYENQNLMPYRLAIAQRYVPQQLFYSSSGIYHLHLPVSGS